MFIASVGMNFAIFVELVGRTRRQLVDADFGMNHILSAVRMAGSRELLESGLNVALGYAGKSCLDTFLKTYLLYHK